MNIARSPMRQRALGTAYGGRHRYRWSAIVDRVESRSESPQVEIVVARCRSGRGAFGMRMEEQADRTWMVAWSFAIAEKCARREGYSTRSIRSPRLNPRLPSCPYCRAQSFVQCHDCDHPTCHMPKDRWFSCRWCPNVGDVSRQMDQLDGLGDV